MDRETRSAIETATQRARRLLEADFREQLDGIFDIRADGRVADEPGAHLDAGQRRIRPRIVAAIAHKRAGGMVPAEAVADYLRDAAFTVLNRFVALKMLEARGLLQPCVSHGEASSGFVEFCGLAPGVKTPDGSGYRLYLECIFDELSTEVKVLFDRRDSASALWPRRAAFLALLELLNAPALAGVWNEDETIGWVYQYFNGQDERRAMREASQAPRNSRELAVRNQFFTPRYVVQFLTDNTLGRIWYEMRDGATALADQCEYMVRRPDETWAPRSKKDPRDIRVLDPACGSGHFLLYAFDLLATIYEEAWADHASPPSEESGSALRADYPDADALGAALPGLILAHNLHGVDIDPRCAQIAQLALWMRAQRAYQQSGVERAQRPLIRRSNIVIAEPMPGEKDLRDEFLGELSGERLVGLMRRALDIPEGKPVRATKAMADSLATLVETVWDGMKLAGEMGVLLKIEQTIKRAIEKGRAEWEDELPLFRVAEYGMTPSGPARVKGETVRFVPGEVDDFWSKAERIVFTALEEYANAARGAGAARRRLFADDVAHGFALIDLLSKRFDVALMNPPFGDPSLNAKTQIFADYSDAKTELYACFMDRCCDLTNGGLIGCLSSRNAYFLSSMEKWRRRILLGDETACLIFVDLGEGVLDAAVECACVVVGPANGQTLCADVSNRARASDRDGSSILLKLAVSDGKFETVQISQLLALPGATLAFQLPPALRSLFAGMPSIAQRGFVAKQGIGTSDNFRFLRLRWEIADIAADGDGWRDYAKGSGFSPMYFDTNLVVRWSADGAEIKAFSASLYGSWSKQITNTQYFGMPGLTYSSRTHRELAPSLMMCGAAFDTKGCCIFPIEANGVANLKALMGYMNSRLFAALLRVGLSRVSQGLARQYTESLVVGMPVPDLENKGLVDLVDRSWDIQRRIACQTETSSEFSVGDWLPILKELQTDAAIDSLRERERLVWQSQVVVSAEIDRRVTSSYLEDTPSEEVHAYLDNEIGVIPHSVEAASKGSAWNALRSSPFFDAGEDLAEERQRVAHQLLSLLLGSALGRWPSAISPKPILVDDPHHPDDVVAGLARHLDGPVSSGIEKLQELVCAASGSSLNTIEFFRRSFFPLHIRDYSSDKRKAPIYWQLATTSGSYSVWLYIRAFNKDTLFRVRNDYVAPKLEHERRQLATLRAEAGASPTSAQSRAIETQKVFVDELAAALDEVSRVAPLWDPDLDDGMIINFAPLWRLVPHHRPWQNELRATWAKLVEGEYDWARLAMRFWPERVVPKCAEDRSLAIAHDLEDVFWFEDDNGKWRKREMPTRPVESLIAERSSSAVKAAVASIVEAPDPLAATRRRGRTAR